ncbi:F0F1 ATP synthase subunit B [Prodigiosinella confusarubida]|uniref:ATP synthase subunit b n=1 Tax=Serratia sp. (strain ATCC 39006) TaxID=104623 RepID=A0A2I5TKN2_SERS3|nr:ATP synthase subunit B [Serratia sp. ATCC 39006]AUH00761.1 F0F1 ATP synthase subunit B [Serratia sp. ATCC 39006]AUH05082.1 F0F1 ATP synthase subunit B [Serratia sp. ATCC 39006]
MLIDWFTVGAQVLNFLILVWLLKHFLYLPILNAIDAREQRIERELADADAKKAEAEQARDEFQHKNTAFDKERASLLSQAKKTANDERQRLLDIAREEAIALSAKCQERLQSEAQELQQEISRRTRQQIFSIARKTLVDLADVTLETRMVLVFVARLQNLSTDEKQKLVDALLVAAQPIVVRTVFELPATDRTIIETQIRELFGAKTTLCFETAPEMVSGIELSANGQKVAWSIAEYLAEMENGVIELLNVKTAQNAIPEEGIVNEH